MARKRTTYDPFFGDALAIAAELAALRHNPTALGRLVTALAQAGSEKEDKASEQPEVADAITR